MNALLDREPRTLDPKHSPSLLRRTRSGRLDRLPWGLAEHLRRTLRRYPDFDDGWGEWPGTLSGVSPEQEQATLAELYRLDRMQRDRLMG